MKVLFLDIDGVLNSTRTAVAFDGFPHSFEQMDKFDAAALALLRKLCEQGVMVVLSSSWRIQYTAEEVSKALKVPVLDVTPTGGRNRGSEIEAWLDENKACDTWAIVDDNSDMLPWQMDRFVQTSTHEGLTLRDYGRLCSLLDLPDRDVLKFLQIL